jgi:hypothetical protein
MAEVAAHPADIPAASEAEQRDYFDAVLERTLAAEARAGAITHRLDVAGVLVRLVFAGAMLDDVLMPALAHLCVADDPTVPVAATLHVWDSAGSGIAMAPPPRGRDCFTERGDIWGLTSARTRIAWHWSDYSVALAQRDLASAIWWVGDAAELPYWSRASPLRTLFHWVMRWHGRHLLHAAAVGAEQGGVLITGAGGAGKSTAALACLAAGMRYVGDDYLIVALDPEPRAISLYATAKLNPDQLARFPMLRAALVNPTALAREKAVLRLFPAYDGQLARSMPLRAVLTPEITGQSQTGFAPAEAARLRHAASFTTITQLPHAGRASQLFIDRLVAALPALTLRLGTDLKAIPAAIADRLARPRTAPAAAARHRPTLSVIIPVHNGAGFLAGAIASILAQDWEAPELIIVDDGSADEIETAAGALPIAARLFRQHNQGPAAARNVGIRNATGELIAFLDVDDLWPTGRLAAMWDILQRDPAIDVVQGHAQLFRMIGDHMQYLGNPQEAFPWSIAAGVYRRTVFSRVGLFDPELRFSEDEDWFRRARECEIRIAWADMVTLLARRHDGNMTRGRSLVEVNRVRVLKKLLDRSRRVAENGK